MGGRVCARPIFFQLAWRLVVEPQVLAPELQAREARSCGSVLLLQAALLLVEGLQVVGEALPERLGALRVSVADGALAVGDIDGDYVVDACEAWAEELSFAATVAVSPMAGLILPKSWPLSVSRTILR